MVEPCEGKLLLPTRLKAKGLIFLSGEAVRYEGVLESQDLGSSPAITAYHLCNLLLSFNLSDPEVTCLVRVDNYIYPNCTAVMIKSQHMEYASNIVDS